jgi:hypothetical protein
LHFKELNKETKHDVYNPTAQEAEVRDIPVPGQPGLHRHCLKKEKKSRKRRVNCTQRQQKEARMRNKGHNDKKLKTEKSTELKVELGSLQTIFSATPEAEIRGS